MFSASLNLFKVKETRNKILFTLFGIFLFRIGSYLPIPGVDADVLKSQDASGLFGIFNTFAGGALQQFSVFAMGIMPYITASIVIQLMQMDVIPNKPAESCALSTSASTPGIGKYEPTRNKNIPNKVNNILLRVSFTRNRLSVALNIIAPRKLLQRLQ